MPSDGGLEAMVQLVGLVHQFLLHSLSFLFVFLDIALVRFGTVILTMGVLVRFRTVILTTRGLVKFETVLVTTISSAWRFRAATTIFFV